MKLFLTLSLLFSVPALADCAKETVYSGAVRIDRGWNPSRNTCAVTLSPRKSLNSQYRAFYFDGTGLFTVQNIYGPGTIKTNRGYREFFILPLKYLEPEFEVQPNRDVTVRLVSGHRFAISARDLSVKAFEPGDFREAPLARDNEGGLEFYLKEGFWFDGGFRTVNSPLSYPFSTSMLRSGKSSPVSGCLLGNQEYLVYKDDHYLMRDEGEALLEFLRYSCPQLKF